MKKQDMIDYIEKILPAFEGLLNNRWTPIQEIRKLYKLAKEKEKKIIKDKE